MPDGRCSYPRCRQPSGVTMFIGGFSMCDKHWDQFCAVDLPEDPTYKEMQRYERRRAVSAFDCELHLAALVAS